jgi:hypothetical protein
VTTLRLDGKGNVYVATNPQQTVLRFPGIGLKDAALAGDRFMVVGSCESAETAGPTAAAFGWTEKDNTCLYVTTTGGLINSREGKVQLLQECSGWTLV